MAKRELMPHQRAALAWAAGRECVPLFMEMRLGKTLVSIRWAEALLPSRVLVVCPLSVVPAWARELQAEGIEPALAVGARSEKLEAIDEGRRWTVTNYEALTDRAAGRRAKASDLSRRCWDVVLLDESTRIRNPRSLVAKAALGSLGPNAEARAVLSGLPNPEDLEDFFCQMAFARGEFMGFRSYWKWRLKHTVQAGPARIVRASSRPLIRAAVAADAFVLSRKDAGLGNRKVRETRWVELPPRALREVRRLEEEFQAGDLLTNNRLHALTMALQIAGGCAFPDERFRHGAKLAALLELATGELAGEPMVVWFRFNEEVEAALAVLRRRGVSCARVVGEDSRDGERGRAVEAFRQGRLRVLLCQTRSLQMGEDLSRSSTAVYFSNYWDGEVRAQSEDRIEHPMKREPLLVVDLVAVGTPDEDVAEAVADKRCGSTAVLAAVRAAYAARRSRPRMSGAIGGAR